MSRNGTLEEAALHNPYHLEHMAADVPAARAAGARARRQARLASGAADPPSPRRPAGRPAVVRGLGDALIALGGRLAGRDLGMGATYGR